METGTEFLPVSREEIEKKGWDKPDFVLITGDAYVDHPSFGTAIIGRLLERYGFSVAILAQPDWRSTADFKKLWKPRLGFLINSGNVDSMVNHFSVFGNRRKTDRYSSGGKAGMRPDRSVIVYSQKVREAYGDVAIIIGGLEASLRRFGHYDYWTDKVRRSVLLDSKANILIYGMGEKAVLEIAESLASGIDISDISWIPGTCTVSSELPKQEIDRGEAMLLPSFEEIIESKETYAESFRMQYMNQDYISAKKLIEPYCESRYVIQNSPQAPLEGIELDDIYQLPYTRRWHPSYDKAGGVPALNEVEFSITANRGCFGGCAFCALTYHQGRQVRGRTRSSILEEGKLLSGLPGFKGYIHDVGGPTANFTGPACDKQKENGVCAHKDCLTPEPCKAMNVNHKEYMKTLRELRALPGVKKVFVRSGLRYDYMLEEKDDISLRELCKHHISGTLKVAPEHVSDNVLRRMRKPGVHVFLKFSEKYRAINKEIGKNQYLIPYFISSHPGSTLDDAIDLALYLQKSGFIPDQVQDFYPTPGTLATCMYYTEQDPLTKERIYVAKTAEEKKMQRALLHFHKKENRGLVQSALRKAGRENAFAVKATTKNKRGKKRIRKN